MSPSDHPESGVQDPNELELGATTSSPSSPQNSAQPQPKAAEPPTVPDNSTSLAENPVAAVPSIQAQSGDAAGANHPATSGESTAPVTATTSSTTTPPNDTPAAVAQPQNTDLPTMDTEEPKAGAELSEEQTEEVDAKEVDEPGPSLAITLLLITGARHPFAIDGKYLRKQSVNVEGNNPFAMSVYTLKELIWREWRSDWESRPSSPSYIRLISFGKLLDDKSPLADSKFSRDAPNVVHMTVKPQEMIDEEDAKGAKAQYGQGREGSGRSPRCRCVIL